MYDLKQDLAAFHEIALRAHNRNNLSKVGPYIASQSVVENSAHQRIAALNKGSQLTLEIGVGGGEHLAFEAPLANDRIYFGLDLECEFLALCRESFGVPVLAANAKSLPFADSTFNTVIACSLFEHVEELDRAVKEIARVLKPDGELLISIPANGGFAVGLYKMLMTYPYLRRHGVKRPAAVWHYLNVNSAQRIYAILCGNFKSVTRESSPWRYLPWFLSPLLLYRCAN